MSKTFNDSATIYTSTSILSEITSQNYLQSKARAVPSNSNIEWTFCIGGSENSTLCELFLSIGTDAVLVSGTISVGPKVSKKYSISPITFNKKGVNETTSIDSSFLGEDGGFITLNLTFELIPQFNLTTFSFDELFQNLILSKPDGYLSVGERRLGIHQSIFSMISPIFASFFKNDKTVVINSAYSFDCVKDVVSLCYGRDVGEQTIDDLLSMMEFAENCCISIVIKKLKQCITESINVFNFCDIAKHAWENGTENLKRICASFFRKNALKIIFKPDFVCFDADLKDKIICAAADL